MKCEHCGNTLKKTDKFCSACGTKREAEKTEVVQVEKKGQAVASLVIGIVSFLIGILFIPLPIIGLILGLTYKGKCGEKTAGIILNSIAIGFSIIVYAILIVLVGLFANNVVDRAVFGSDDPYGVEFRIDEDTDWNTYSWIRTTANGTEKSLIGEWRLLGEENHYYVIGEEDFAFYDSFYVKNNNYYEGTYVTETGGTLQYYGINPSDIEKSLKDVKRENTYLIEFMPEKVVIDGVEETENLKSYEYVWYIEEHEDGIEATVYDKTTKETTHYVKMSD